MSVFYGKKYKIITQGLGTRGLITQGYGTWTVEIEEIPRAGLPTAYKIKVFGVKIPVLGHTVHDYTKGIMVTGIKDFRQLLLVLENEEPDELDEILKLVDLYGKLKAQVELKIAKEKDLETLKDCKKVIDDMLKKWKEKANEK